MPGMTVAADISGSLDVKNLVMGVLEKGVALSNLMSIIKTTVQVPRLDANIPVLTQGAVTEDVEELQETNIEGGTFTNINFSLKKDRVKLAITDEAEYRSLSGNPLEIQKQGAGVKLAAALDKKIADALETSPQTSACAGAATWNTTTNSALVELGTAAAAIRPYTADFVVMNKYVWSKYIQNTVVTNAGSVNAPGLAGAVAKVPGLNLDIFIDENIANHSFVVGASNGMPAILGNGPVKVDQWREAGKGATIYQMDVYRQVKAPIFLNSSSLNMATYKVTAITT